VADALARTGPTCDLRTHLRACAGAVLADDRAMQLPEGVVVAQGDLDHVRGLRRLLREHGITAKLVRPPGRSGGG
jgi:hypothetical protein